MTHFSCNRAILAILGMAAWMFSGCIFRTVYSSPSEPETATRPPLPVWAVYWPNPVQPSRSTIRPVPAHLGWTNIQMERDLLRMAECGVTASLVAVTPQQLLTSEFQERYSTYLNSAQAAGVQVALFLVSASSPAPALERQNITQYFLEQKFIDHPATLCQDEIPVLVVSCDFVLDPPSPEALEPLRILQFGHELPSRPSGPLDISTLHPDSQGVMWIRAADNSGCAPINRGRPADDWAIPRRKGSALRKQLKQARTSEARLLLLDSWNDYQRGSFVETNSLEQDDLLKILTNR